MTAEQLVRKLHRQLVRDTARAQQTVLLIEALQVRFGDFALDPTEQLQDNDRALTDATVMRAMRLKSRAVRTEENLQAIRDIEEKLEAKNFADLKGMVDYVASRTARRKEVKD